MLTERTCEGPTTSYIEDKRRNPLYIQKKRKCPLSFFFLSISIPAYESWKTCAENSIYRVRGDWGEEDQTRNASLPEWIPSRSAYLILSIIYKQPFLTSRMRKICLLVDKHYGIGDWIYPTRIFVFASFLKRNGGNTKIYVLRSRCWRWRAAFLACGQSRINSCRPSCLVFRAVALFSVYLSIFFAWGTNLSILHSDYSNRRSSLYLLLLLPAWRERLRRHSPPTL